MDEHGNGGAEAVLNLQPSSSVSIVYHQLFGPHEDLLLLEADEKLLPDFLNERVTLRGMPDEDAVLCTESKTYGVKFVGTSNSLFVIPPSSDPTGFNADAQNSDVKNSNKLHASTIKLAPGQMELVEVAPRLDKLKLLLMEKPYHLTEETVMEDLERDERNQMGLYSWDDLVNKVQASNDELRSGLQAISAVEIDGYWRIVDDKYMDMILRLLLHNAVLNDWSLDTLDEEEVATVLKSDGYPDKLARHCLHVYGTKVNEDTGRCVWKLDEKRVGVHFAREILRNGKRKLESFMAEWIPKIPDGMQASFDMLEGEVLTEKIGFETWVHAYSVRSLPSTPAERFSALFKQRPRWGSKDLEPYIRDLNVPGVSLEGLLLKYTRRTQPTQDAEPVFSAR